MLLIENPFWDSHYIQCMYVTQCDILQTIYFLKAYHLVTIMTETKTYKKINTKTKTHRHRERQIQGASKTHCMLYICYIYIYQKLGVQGFKMWYWLYSCDDKDKDKEMLEMGEYFSGMNIFSCEYFQGCFFRGEYFSVVNVAAQPLSLTRGPNSSSIWSSFNLFIATMFEIFIFIWFTISRQIFVECEVLAKLWKYRWPGRWQRWTWHLNPVISGDNKLIWFTRKRPWHAVKTFLLPIAIVVIIIKALTINIPGQVRDKRCRLQIDKSNQCICLSTNQMFPKTDQS